VFQALTLRQQLICLCSIFFVPIVLLALLLTQRAQSDIAFSQAERDGVAYLKTVAPIIAKSASGTPATDLASFEAANIRFDTVMQSWQQSTALRIALESDATRVQTVDAGINLITAIGDGSNLILDPDLDSYYIMDILVARLPVLMSQLTKLDSQIEADQAFLDQSKHSDLLLLQGQIKSARQSLEGAMSAAVRNNSAGSISRTMLESYSKLIVEMDHHIADLSSFTQENASNEQRLEAANSLRADFRPLMSKIYVAYASYLNVLDELLATRIAKKYEDLYISLGISVGAVLIALLFSFVLMHHISRKVSLVSRRIHAMTEGDFTSPIPLQSHKDEFGQIAQSLKVFRAHSEEKAALAEIINTERQSNAKALEALAYLDDLTGLPNRKFLDSRLSNCLNLDNDNDISALIYFDLDGFKEVNDTMTHQAGDEVLKEAALRLSRFLRDDDIAARLGGDEFAILIGTAGDKVLLEQMCVRILQSLAEPYRIRGSLHYLTASAGIALITATSAHDTRELLRRADVAMYRAKKLGKNRAVFFDSSFDTEALYRKAIESALREGLQRGEVYLDFQPQFDGPSGRMVGVEGLARWSSQRHGEISPSVFIPIAEQSGLIHELGKQVLQQAILAVRRWPQLRISVNLSVAQLRHHKFVDDIAELMIEMSAPSNRIELEITESVVMEDDRLLTAKFAALRDLGFRLAIDDFGTGYSSLSYLSRYRFDLLKIDRGFIRNVTNNARGIALLKSIASLGLALDMDVCAEGVETHEDVRTAVEAGCKLLQGFYFSKAVSIDEIDRMLANGLSETATKQETSAFARLAG
jgi:diguanylate cyclase (GGDEF)-like protein